MFHCNIETGRPNADSGDVLLSESPTTENHLSPPKTVAVSPQLSLEPFPPHFLIISHSSVFVAAFSHFTEQLDYLESLEIFEKLFFITMSYISRNQSDLPLTASETSDFIAAEEQNEVDNSKKGSNNLKRKESQASKSSAKSIRKR